MYLEFLFVIGDYFKTINKKIVLYEWGLPLIFSIICIFFKDSFKLELFGEIKEVSISILGVLLGFSIAVITIITTGNGKNLEEIKKVLTKVKIGKNNISLYDLILINFSYTVVIEVIFILSCVLFPILDKIVIFSHTLKVYLYLMMIFIIIHVLLLTLRNITDFYLIITKK